MLPKNRRHQKNETSICSNKTHKNTPDGQKKQWKKRQQIKNIVKTDQTNN